MTDAAKPNICSMAEIEAQEQCELDGGCCGDVLKLELWRAIDLLRQVSDIGNGASIYLGHNDRIVKDIDTYLARFSDA